MEKADCFTILQVSPAATLKEARKAYMRLVKRWHPDRFTDNSQMRESAQEKLKIINSAYEEVKTAICARIERESQRSFSKPAPDSREKSSDDSYTNIAEPLPPRNFFSVFRNSIPRGIRQFFSSEKATAPQQVRERRRPPKPGMSAGGKGEEKDFQKIFNDAVRSKTGRPYRPLKRANRPVEPSEKEPKARAQNAAYRPIRPRRKAGERVARVEPVSKIKGL